VARGPKCDMNVPAQVSAVSGLGAGVGHGARIRAFERWVIEEARQLAEQTEARSVEGIRQQLRQSAGGIDDLAKVVFECHGAWQLVGIDLHACECALWILPGC